MTETPMLAPGWFSLAKDTGIGLVRLFKRAKPIDVMLVDNDHRPCASGYLEDAEGNRYSPTPGGHVKLPRKLLGQYLNVFNHDRFLRSVVLEAVVGVPCVIVIGSLVQG
jgi:hypothetical protein